MVSLSADPSENMVWADQEGNIGWQAAGITPIRPNWSGLLPVPGDGGFEWDGYLPIQMLPNIANPPNGFIATANQNNLPDGYPYKVGYIWSDPFRHARLVEFLNQKRRFTLSDMVELQLDVISIPARSLVPLLKGIETDSFFRLERCLCVQRLEFLYSVRLLAAFQSLSKSVLQQVIYLLCQTRIICDQQM